VDEDGLTVWVGEARAAVGEVSAGVGAVEPPFTRVVEVVVRY
jgi:hypothetical protein